MNLTEILKSEWRPALGCTEPASIAYCAALASAQVDGDIQAVRLTCDPRIYKNCFAVGIPNSEKKSGILWAAAIGAFVEDTSLALEVFEAIDKDVIERAQKLMDSGRVAVEVDDSKSQLWVDCFVMTSNGTGRCVFEDHHTGLTRIEKDGKAIHEKKNGAKKEEKSVSEQLSQTPITELVTLAQSLTDEDRKRLQLGIDYNFAIAEYGYNLFPEKFTERDTSDFQAHVSHLVSGGIFARMSGEDYPVMSLAGSGNKGITASIPTVKWGESLGKTKEEIYQALTLACLITSASTWHLGTLSAVCGCSNAAGIGLAVARVFMEGGEEKEITLAINNMVGNVAGMICDGAKIGCSLKGITAVDAAYRSANLALSGMGIPPSDGIVGKTGELSLANLSRIANHGMKFTDSEILRIMQDKLK